MTWRTHVLDTLGVFAHHAQQLLAVVEVGAPAFWTLFPGAQAIRVETVLLAQVARLI